MMDRDLIQSWRSKHADVYNVAVGGQEFWFRALTVAEVNEITEFVEQNSTAIDIEDIYVQRAILYPYDLDLDDLKAGHVSQLANEIMTVSGVADISFVLSTLLERRMEIQSDLVAMMKVFIISAMPSCTEAELDSLTVRQLTEKVVFAEQIHTLHQNINGIASDGVEFQITLDEGEEEQVQKKPEPKPKIDKDVLLKRIRQDEKGMTDLNKVPQGTIGQLENFDEEVLLKAAGVLKPNDPIAEKLRQAMGG